MTTAHRIAILGGGDLSLGPAVAASLAAYQGERRLQLAFYDPNPDGAGLMAGIVRKLAYFIRVRPETMVSKSAEEALEGAQAAILFPEFAASGEALPIPSIVIPQDGWPTPLPGSDDPSFRFQLLRWANGEEEPIHMLAENERSPIQAFLDRVLRA
ncbi:hypothetical protein EON79_06010 [bacterium]|nr:MAG: hypothetical protein EON79_06010 [bacterium]